MKNLPQPEVPISLAESFDELLEVTRQRVADDVRAPATLQMQAAHANWWCHNFGAETPLEDMDERVLDHLATARRHPPKSAHGGALRSWGPSTLRKRMSTLKAAMQLQHRRRRLDRVPAFPRVLVKRPPTP
ncbi:MAG: hypothetical protein ACJ79H_10085, partial [Myxococcales bacterium]